MTISPEAQNIIDRFDPENPRMGALKKCAAEIGTNHALAMELWQDGGYTARLIAVLLMDKCLLDQMLIETLAADLEQMGDTNRNRISEWLMANQLMKSARTKKLLLSWADHDSPVLRRLFWYYQARLRWTGKIPVDNAKELLDALQGRMQHEHPDVQWTMNFCAAWIGVYQPEFRDECVALGEKLGLYKGEKEVPGCTPNYLPRFIEVETAKRA